MCNKLYVVVKVCICAHIGKLERCMAERNIVSVVMFYCYEYISLARFIGKTTMAVVRVIILRKAFGACMTPQQPEAISKVCGHVPGPKTTSLFFIMIILYVKFLNGPISYSYFRTTQCTRIVRKCIIKQLLTELSLAMLIKRRRLLFLFINYFILSWNGHLQF